MAIAFGETVYEEVFGAVAVFGKALSEADLDAALHDHVAALVWDEVGEQQIQSILSDVATTTFQVEALKEVLSHDRTPEDWRVGEAIAEAYLIDHYRCEFPWPTGRDLKNPSASPAGTDLVGFQHIDGDVRFAFGEVKTSVRKEWPPSVVTGRHGLHNQIEELRDSPVIKDELAKYLAHHAHERSWKPLFQRAARRYLSNRQDISLFGLLIRDVRPDIRDLRTRAIALANECSTIISIALFGIYLPTGVIPSLPTRVVEARRH